ncbi:MAG: GDSL-type esterase/lipase family protein [Planctomycetota bacterium]
MHRFCLLALPLSLLAALASTRAEAVSFDRVVALGDSLFDDSAGVRSPVAAEHVADALRAPLTNLAVSGDNSSQLIASGWHTTAAASFGEGDLAALWIGGNDLFDSALAITFGLFGAVDTLESNVDTILDTLTEAGMEVVVFNLPDLSDVPVTLGIQNFGVATVDWNNRLDALAQQYGATVVDVFSLFEAINADPTQFDLYGNTPEVRDSLLLDCPLCVFEDPIHPSSFAQGFIANEAIGAINAAYDPQGQMPLEELSIVDIALLADVYAGDFDSSGAVTATDVVFWENGFGQTGGTHAAGDADLDLDTDVSDLLILQRQFGFGTAAVAAVPEPSVLALAAITSVVLCLHGGGRGRLAYFGITRLS